MPPYSKNPASAPKEDAENALALLGRADVALAAADTVVKAKELRDIALTAGDWLKRRDASKEIVLKARALALDAERKMGEMLATASLAIGGRPKETGNIELPVSDNPTLKELGISKRESSRAQALAKMPDEKFEEIKKGVKTLSQARREVATGNSSTPEIEKLLEKAINRFEELSKRIPETMTNRIFRCFEKTLNIFIEKYSYEALREKHAQICDDLATKFRCVADKGWKEQWDKRREGVIFWDGKHLDEYSLPVKKKPRDMVKKTEKEFNARMQRGLNTMNEIARKKGLC
jgi:hypothetical protein